MAIKDWTPAQMARFIVISVSINFLSLVMLMYIAFNNIGNIENLVDRANINAHRISVNQYNQCIEANAATKSRNESIDSAIEAERREKAPDKKRLNDLENIKFPIRQCGDDPRTDAEVMKEHP